MFDENRVKIDDLLNHPATLKVLLALANVGQAYQFQLTRITGHHSRMLGEALEILMRARMIKVVPGKVRIRNTGDFYALTPHGVVVAKCLQDLGKTLESAK